MRFCDRCGSRMKSTKMGFACVKCGYTVRAKIGLIEVANMNPTEPSPIYVVEDSKRFEAPKVSRICLR